VVQAEGASPFHDFIHSGGEFRPVQHPETLATAIKIGDPVSWPKARNEIIASNGIVERVSEQEIADAKAVIGQCGFGCEPASAATLAGIRKLRTAGIIGKDADVIGVLTGNVLKDPDYIFRYHTAQLELPGGERLQSTFSNAPTVIPNDPDEIARRIS
jgi:threonine synthase